VIENRQVQKKVTDMPNMIERTTALLAFLKDMATLRRNRIPSYGTGDGDKILWFGDIPRGLSRLWKDACTSALTGDDATGFPDLWLEVRKRRKPMLKALPEELQDWVPRELQDNPDDYVHRQTETLLGLLNTDITILGGRGILDPFQLSDADRSIMEVAPEKHCIGDHPEVQNAWVDYLTDCWEPWVREMRQWEQVQAIYEQVDFMRRRLEEAEERYELVVAIGLVQWRDSVGVTVKRHVLTAPAEISLHAEQGILTVGPAASFERLRVELDMLELQDQPVLEGTDIEVRLEKLDVRVWDKVGVAEVLRIIANRASPNSQVNEDDWMPVDWPDDIFRVLYAPALVLRERRPTAYEEVITRFLKAAENEPTFARTAPWERFLGEGAVPECSCKAAPDVGHGLKEVDNRLYFPLAMNDEQQRIIACLSARPYVLVKGPPGTGKSHTIANLICHLLATGERVLVTAHAHKALAVLRDLLPSDIRNLCVIALGSTREEHRLLEDSVRGILSRKSEWKGEEWASAAIHSLEQDLYQLECRVAQVDRQLRECREAETYSHILPGGYVGTTAEIALQIEAASHLYDWFPEPADERESYPLQPEGAEFLADIHTSLTEQQMRELRLDIGNFTLPDPLEYAEALERLNASEGQTRAALDGLPKDKTDALQRFSGGNLKALEELLAQLNTIAVRAGRLFGEPTSEVLEVLLAGQHPRWDRLEQQVSELAAAIDEASGRAGATRIDTPSDIEGPRLLADARRRYEHFRKGGWRGWGSVAPRAARETRYLEVCCRVDLKAPNSLQTLDELVGFLELKESVEGFYCLWPSMPNPIPNDPRRVAHEILDWVQLFHQLLQLFRGCEGSVLDVVPIEDRATLVGPNGRATWRLLIQAELSRRVECQARAPFEGWRNAILGVAREKAHPCINELAEAIDHRDSAGWGIAWRVRENLRATRDRYQRYQGLLEDLRCVCPELVHIVESTQGDPQWTDRLVHLKEAWYWSAAKAWLRNVIDPGHYERLLAERLRLQSRIGRKLEELTSGKAWQSFFLHLDDSTEQNLVAWKKAVTRIGKRTGKYVYRHERAARNYLKSCIAKMPAWVMPLYKLWETTDVTPGVFDTVIIDEASQAGTEALALLLLSKRIIIVGDDKQDSPEAVGVSEDDIARLARNHLREFRFCHEFRPDTSLYDHAERAFGSSGSISLREHFRCVPEIIRFSNNLCYTDAPLIPLRQPPPKRLQPLMVDFVDQGYCEGERQRIVNRAEAEAVVAAILKCLESKAYEGKTMGVIALQGRAQAEYIEKRLAEVLEPRVREERKLRCGVPATFQGDQRDVIFLSLVAAPNRRFRALTGLPDQRRFNVAMSRARDQVWMLHSVQQHDLNREDLRWQLLNFFYDPTGGALEAVHEELERLERLAREAGRGPRQLGEQPDPYESWFEFDVALELLRRRYRLRPQVEFAGYRIDLVLEGLVNHRLAVECDGDAWHGPERFDQDMIRQRQLERAGLKFVRVRESEFYLDRRGAIGRIVEACDELGIKPVGEEKTEEHNERTPRLGASETRPREHIEEAKPSDCIGDNEETHGKHEEDQPFVPVVRSPERPGLPDPRNSAPAALREALCKIIEKEGPITKRFLFRLYVEECPSLSRSGKAVRKTLNRALLHMQRAGEIVLEDELGDRSLESQVLWLTNSPRVKERAAGRRDLLEIPSSEFFAVLDRLVGATNDCYKDDTLLCRVLLEHFGFARLTEVRKSHLTRVLEQYRRRQART